MVTTQQAKEALDNLWETSSEYGCHKEWYMLEEFIKQYEDWVKVKTLTHGILLKGKEDS